MSSLLLLLPDDEEEEEREGAGVEMVSVVREERGPRRWRNGFSSSVVTEIRYRDAVADEKEEDDDDDDDVMAMFSSVHHAPTLPNASKSPGQVLRLPSSSTTTE